MRRDTFATLLLAAGIALALVLVERGGEADDARLPADAAGRSLEVDARPQVPEADARPSLPRTDAHPRVPDADARRHFLEMETRRIAAHLARVEEELRSRDVSHLPSAERRARRERLHHLREYREGLRFPRNLDFPGERVPYFRDARGTLCAVAYLLDRSGQAELVDRIARERNHATVHELADEGELVEWLERSGLTLDEAARIQPQYGCCWPAPEEPEDRLGGTYVTASLAAATLGGVGSGILLAGSGNPDERRWPAAMATAAGATGIGLGAARLGDSGSPRRVGALNAALGALSMGLGLRGIRIGGGDGEPTASEGAIGAKREGEGRARAGAGGAAIRLLPRVDPDGRTGAVIRVTF